MKLPLKLPQTTGLVFLMGIVIFGLGVFQILSLPSRQREISRAENNLLVLKQKSERLSEILSEIKTLESNLEVAQIALPASDDVPNLIMQLEQIAKQSGMMVQHLGFGEGKAATTPKEEGVEEVKEVSGIKEISLTAVVNGSYGALQTFLRNLESASRIVNVTNFRFSQGQKEGEEGGLSVTLGMEAFYLPAVDKVSIDTPLTLDTTSKEYIELIREVKALRVYRPEVGE